MPLKDAPATPEFYRQLYRYNRIVLEKYVERCRRMGPRRARADRGTGIGSYQETLAHILRVHDAWLNYVVPDDLEGLHASHDAWAKTIRTMDLRAYQRRAWKGIDRLLRGLSPAQLHKVVKAPWMPGRYTLADVLMQCTLEQAHHLGELIGVSWQDDRASPQMMWIPTLTGSRMGVG